MMPAIRNHLAMTPWTTPINRLEGLFDRLFDDSFFGVRPSGGGGDAPLALAGSRTISTSRPICRGCPTRTSR